MTFAFGVHAQDQVRRHSALAQARVEGVPALACGACPSEPIHSA